MRVSLCTTVVHNTAQNSSDNFPSHPPQNHHSSNDVKWRGGEQLSKGSRFRDPAKAGKEGPLNRDEPVISRGDSRWNELVDPHLNETDVIQVGRQPLHVSGHVYAKIRRRCQQRLNVFQALQHLREVT